MREACPEDSSDLLECQKLIMYRGPTYGKRIIPQDLPDPRSKPNAIADRLQCVYSAKEKESNDHSHKAVDGPVFGELGSQFFDPFDWKEALVRLGSLEHCFDIEEA